MKTLKIATIATIVTALIIALCGVATANAETADTYTLPAVVTAWEQISNTDLYIVDCTAKDGNVWSFFADGYVYKIGDVVVLTMWKATEAEEDDEIIDAVRIDHLSAEAVASFLK